MITAHDVAEIPLFAKLPAEHLAQIAARAADVRLQPDQWLIQEGESSSFFALLEGTLDVIKVVGGTEQVINRYTPGDFFGEVPLILGSGAVASLRAREPARVLRLDPDDFQALVISDDLLSAQLLRTMAARVGHLQRLAVEAPLNRVQIIGHRWDPGCLDLRGFLARNHVPSEWLDLDTPADLEQIPEAARDAERYPLVLLPDEAILITPALRELADRVGLQTSPGKSCYDVAIIGAGPAGLAAAVYGASEGLSTVLIEREAPGGQAGTSSRIENYLGFPSGLSGDELSQRAWQQATRFGAEMVVARDVIGIDPTPGAYAVLLDGGTRVECKAIVIATGVVWRRLDAPGVEELTGRGVYYGASRTEAPATQGKDVYLIGGGNSAGQAALFFAGYVRQVYMLIRGEALSASMSQYLIDQLEATENVSVEPFSELSAARGETHLEAIVIRDARTGEERLCQTDALFVFIGADPETESLPGEIACDKRGYLLTGPAALRELERAGGRPRRDPYLLETTVPGIFAVGDVRAESIKRVASAVGEGSMAIAFVHQFLAEQSAPRA